MSEQIKTPNGLPADFHKSPQDIADEINAKVDAIRESQGNDAANAAVVELTDRANSDHRRAAEQINRDRLASSGQDAQEEPDNSPVEDLIGAFYTALTPELRAILSAKVNVVAVLSQNEDGTLHIDVHPAQQVIGVDMEKKVVHLAKPDSEEKPRFVHPPTPVLKEHVCEDHGGDCCGKSPCENDQG